MNSNKSFDRYGIAKYFLIADLLIFVAGIVIMSIFGFNISSTQGSHLVLQSVLSVVISLILVAVYISIRHDFAKAFSAILISVHNVLLATALICLIRIPVSETLTMGYVLLVGLSTIFGMILFENVGKFEDKKIDKNLTIKNTLAENLKLISVFSAIIVAVMFLSMIFASNSIFDFAREFFVMMIVLLYSVVVLMLPIYLYFAKRIKKRSRAKIDKSVENQKVYQASQQEITENENVNENV